jgi:hypothetical protein
MSTSEGSSWVWMQARKGKIAVEDHERGGGFKLKPKSGAKNPMSKLNEDDVRRIKRLYVRLKGKSTGLVPALAKKFNVQACAVYDIIKGKTWRHVNI